MLLIGVSFAYAIDYGATLTQAQIDALNMQTINLNIEHQQYITQSGYIKEKIKYDYIKPFMDDDKIMYLYGYRYRYINSVKVSDYLLCREYTTEANCQIYAKIVLYINRHNYENSYRVQLAKLQTEPATDITIT